MKVFFQLAVTGFIPDSETSLYLFIPPEATFDNTYVTEKT